MFFGGDLAGKAEQVGNQILRAAGLIANLDAHRVGPRRFRIFDDQEVGISENGGERIIYFVSGSGGKLAERGQLFRLHEMSLKALDVLERFPELVHQGGALLIDQMLPEENQSGPQEKSDQSDDEAESLHREGSVAEKDVPPGQE